MAKPSLIILVVFIALVAGSCGEDPPRPISKEEHREPVKALITTMNDSLFAGKIAPVLDYTHPKLIAAMGGREAAERKMAEEMEELRAVGMKPESFVIDPEPTFYQGAKHLHVIVESTTVFVFSTSAQRVESRAFRVGVLLDDGWRFAEGSGLTPTLIDHLFPDLPAGIKLPAVWQKPLPNP